MTKTSASKELLEALEARLGTLETSVTRLDSRVTLIEGSKDYAAVPATSPQQSSITHDTNIFDFETNEISPAETQDPTDGIGSVVFTKEEESGFFGPSSNIAFTRQIVRTTTAILKATVSTASPLSPGNAALQSHMLHVSRPPSRASNRLNNSQKACIATEPFALPEKNETLRLIDVYFDTTGVLFPYIDKEGFLQSYHQLNLTNIRTARRSWLGLLNMVLAMSASASHGGTLTASERASESDICYRRALALCEKQIRHGTNLEIVQVLLLMSQYLQGTERSIETWNVHGLAVKAAYQLGLHSPNALNQYPPREQEFRKRTWFGCVVLDRTLSMTLGRPASIPDKFIKLVLPCSLETLPLRPNAANATILGSVQFYSATITLYAIMGEVVDILYGNNLGCDDPDDMFDVAAHLLQFEQKFLAWQCSLPDNLHLVEPDMLRAGTGDQNALRFRLILTVRYLNLRILTHRPLLCKYLEFLGTAQFDSPELCLLRQVGENSVRICIESALTIIELMREVLNPSQSRRHLLGAWWFSLYYAFNAALVIYSTLLVQHQGKKNAQFPTFKDIDLSIDSLRRAIDCLSLLSKGNRMTEKCIRYTSSLADLLAVIYCPNGPQILNPATDLSFDQLGNPSTLRSSNDAQPDDLFDFLDSNDLHMGMSLDEIFGADFSFMTASKSLGL